MAEPKSFQESAKLFLDVADFVASIDSPMQSQYVDDIRISKSLVCHFLYAIVVELSMKAIYEKHCRSIPDRTHKITGIYQKLPENIKRTIKSIYEDTVTDWKQVKGQRDDTSFTIGERFHFLTFDDALANNEKLMTSFKYDGLLHTDISPIISTIIRDDDSIYVIPRKSFAPFAQRLFDAI